MNKFPNHAAAIFGPAIDALPVTPDTSIDLPQAEVGLYVETGSNIDIATMKAKPLTK